MKPGKLKLYYWNERPNFGDALNPWLWSRLIPDLIDADGDAVFVGIGTLLNERLPIAKTHIIYGAGVGYSKYKTKLEPSWRVYCVRGPMSAAVLGLPREYAVTDPGILMRRFRKTNFMGKRKYKYSYMPHWSAAGPEWERVCGDIGLGYIDPQKPVDEVLDDVQSTEVLLAEAMHGAIVADALRVPWVPIQSDADLFRFKWEDWCKSINVDYAPLRISSALVPKKEGMYRRIIQFVKPLIVKQEIKNILKTCQPILSDETTLERLTVELEDRLERVRKDYILGL